jgi:hypothetical protein
MCGVICQKFHNLANFGGQIFAFLNLKNTISTHTKDLFFGVNKLALICHISNLKNCPISPIINGFFKKKIFHIWSTPKFG